MKVATTNGTTLHDCVPGTRNQAQKDGEPLTEEAANKLMEQANQQAAELGITTRYEVVS